MTTKTARRETDLDGDIRDANLGLIVSTARLLEEADRLRKHRDRLLDLIRQRPPVDVAEAATEGDTDDR